MEQKKIIFSGLDKVGKTSIIEGFLNQFTIVNPIPTAGIRRKRLLNLDWLGFQITSWDLGGQNQYRDDHFKNTKIFANTSTLFFVIDLQENSRIDLAIDYFSKILHQFQNLGESPQFLIVFNKFDPKLQTDKKLLDRIANFTQRFKDTFPSEPLNFYRTSIYDTATILDVFYHGMIKSSQKGVLIEKALKKYAQLTFSSASVLLDSSSLIIGAQSSQSRYIDVCETIAPWLATAMEKINRYSINFEHIQGVIALNSDSPFSHHEAERGRIFAKRFQASHGNFFTIISYSRNTRTGTLSEKYLPELAETLTNLIETINR